MKQRLLHAGPIPSSSCTLPFLKCKIKISAEGSALATPPFPAALSDSGVGGLGMPLAGGAATPCCRGKGKTHQMHSLKQRKATAELEVGSGHRTWG